MYFELKENKPHGTKDDPFSTYHIENAGRLAQLLRILAHGDGVLVHDAIDAVVIVLHVYPLTQRTHVVANGQFT